MGAVRDRLLSGRSREFAIAVAAGAAMLLASLANFLTHNSYPYFRPEIGLIIAGLLALAALMAAWYIPQRQWGRSFLEGLLAAIFVDLNTDAVWMIFVAGVGVAAITFWWRISLLGPMAVLGSVIFLTTIAGIGGRPAWINTIKGGAVESGAAAAGKPAILHIILDEHLGLQGMAAEGPDG